jgi:uncharacterized cupin superfamily protein
VCSTRASPARPEIDFGCKNDPQEARENLTMWFPERIRNLPPASPGCLWAVHKLFKCFEIRMPLPLIETGQCNVDLKPSPIKPSWIIEGNPEARSHKLSASADGAAATLIWACTEGKFNWYYDFDETIIILEGSVVLESEGMPPKRYGVGEVIFFRSGAHVKWHVEGYVKKVAFCRLKRMFFKLPAGHLLRFCFSAAILNGSV